MAIKAAELYVRVGAETGEAEKGLLGVATQLNSVATQAGAVGGAIGSGVVGALGALVLPVNVVTVGLGGLTATWGGLTGAMVASGGVMQGVAALLGVALPTAMGATTVSMGLLSVAWSGGWGGMNTATSEAWQNGIQPTLAALTSYLTVTIPGALGTMRSAWQRDWGAAAGAIDAVSAAFDALVARLSRPLPNPVQGIGGAGGGVGTTTPPPIRPTGGRGSAALMSGLAAGAPPAPRATGAEAGEQSEVVALLRALLLAVQRQERTVRIELDGREVGRAMSRQRATSLLYDARS